MTVVVGFVGLDGAVMASDSEATESDHTRFDAPKIWECHGLLLGYSGNTAVEHPLAQAINEGLKYEVDRSRGACVKCIQDAAQPVLARVYSKYEPRPPEGQIPSEIAGKLLVAGHDANGYWLGHLSESNMFTYATRLFHAIGAGSVGAQVATGLLSRYAVAGRSLSDVRLIAHRTVTAVMTVLGGVYGVGGSVLMWDSLHGAPFRELSKDEIQRVGSTVDGWVTIEKESLGLLTGQATETVTETGLIIATALPGDIETPVTRATRL